MSLPAVFSGVVIWLALTSFPLFWLLVSAIISHTCVSLAVPPFRTQAPAFFYFVSQLSLLAVYPVLVIPRWFYWMELANCVFLAPDALPPTLHSSCWSILAFFPRPFWLLVPLYIRIFFLALGFPWIWSANTLTVYRCVGFTLVL